MKQPAQEAESHGRQALAIKQLRMVAVVYL